MDNWELDALYNPFVCRYVEDDDDLPSGDVSDPDPEPEPDAQPDPEPDPEPEPEPEPEAEKAPEWFSQFADGLENRLTQLEAGQKPELEPDPALFPEDDDKPMTKGEMKKIIAEDRRQQQVVSANAMVMERCNELKAEYPDIIVKDPQSGLDVVNPKYKNDIQSFLADASYGDRFEALLRFRYPRGKKPAPTPAPGGDDITLDSPQPPGAEKEPNYKDADSFDEVGDMLDRQGG